MRLSNFQRLILPVLIDAIKKGEVLSYRELAERMGRPGETLAIPNALGAISEYTYDEIGVFISVIVINEKTGRAGSGFIQMASRYMELEETLNDGFLRNHMKAVHAISHKELDKLLV